MENMIGASGDRGLYHRLHDSTGVLNQIAGTGDDSRLNELGYKQELRRSLSLLANFSMSFSIISVITGVTTLFSTGLTFGGPISMVYGWPIAGLFSLLVGISMSEICSAYPTAAGLYFWSAKLCGNDWGPFACWITGWIYVLCKAGLGFRFWCGLIGMKAFILQVTSLEMMKEE